MNVRADYNDARNGVNTMKAADALVRFPSNAARARAGERFDWEAVLPL